MKRDMNLIRDILLKMEASSDDDFSDLNNNEGVSDRVLHYHYKLMLQADLIEAVDASTHDGLYFHVVRITWNGHEFLGNARDERVWKKTIAKLGTYASGLPFEVLTNALRTVVQANVKSLLNS